MASEMDDCADGNASVIGGAARVEVVKADIVDLWPQRQVRKNGEIHAAANAIREAVGRAAAASHGHVPVTRKELNKRRDIRWVVHDDARAEEEGVGVKRNAAGGSVVAAEIADNSQKWDGFVGDRAADAVLAKVGAAAEVEVGVADGGVKGRLSARRQGENEQSQAKKEQAFHRKDPFERK